MGAFLATAVGVAGVFAWSAVGGFGAPEGYPWGFAVTLAPYPLGVLAAAYFAVRMLREPDAG